MMAVLPADAATPLRVIITEPSTNRHLSDPRPGSVERVGLLRHGGEFGLEAQEYR
ncbi:hypothetical protein SAMN05444370_1041, partial [Rubrimonas cliftonensis]